MGIYGFYLLHIQQLFITKPTILAPKKLGSFRPPQAAVLKKKSDERMLGIVMPEKYFEWGIPLP